MFYCVRMFRSLVTIIRPFCASIFRLDLVTSPDHPPATYWVQHTISCITQSNAPEDEQNCCPKHVELIWIKNKPLLLYIVALFLPSLLMMHGQTNIKLLFVHKTFILPCFRYWTLVIKISNSTPKFPSQ